MGTGETISTGFPVGSFVKGTEAGTTEVTTTGIQGYDGDNADVSVTTGVNNIKGKSLVMIKNRNNTGNMLWYDTVRGDNRRLFTHLQNKSSEANALGTLKWQTSGFRVPSGDGDLNTAARGTYDSYNIRAATGHFDIVTYRGNGEPFQEISHDLGKPGMMIVKNITSSGNFAVYHSSMGAEYYAPMNTAGGYELFSAAWNDTNPNDKLFTVGDGFLNMVDEEYIAYLFSNNRETMATGKCLHSVKVDLDFAPAIVILKNTDPGGSNWFFFDSNRGNGNAYYLNTNAKNTGGFNMSLEGDGFTQELMTEATYIAIGPNQSKGFAENPTGVVASVDDDTNSMGLADVVGDWGVGDKVISRTALTESAPDPDTLEFVGSVPAASAGTISSWGDATWTVTNTLDSSVQTESKAIAAGQQQKLSVGNNIT